MAEAKSGKGKKLLLIFRVAFVAAGLLWGWQRGWFGRSTLEVFKQLHLLTFAVALAGYILGQLSVALRWWILLRTQGIFIPLGAAIRLIFLGLFYNNFMPGAVGGDLVRAWYTMKHTEKRFEAALSVLVDRIVGLAGSVVIAVVFYFLLPTGSASLTTGGTNKELSVTGGSFGSIGLYEKIFIWSVAVIVAAVLILFIIPQTRNILRKWWQLGCEHGGRLWVKLVQAGVLYCKKPVEMIVVLVLTIALQIVTIAGYWLMGRQIGVDVSLSYYLVFFTISWSIGMVPISVGGAILVEGSLAAMFEKIALVQAGPAQVLAMCQRIIWMVTSLPGGLVHLLGGHLPKDFSMGSTNSP